MNEINVIHLIDSSGFYGAERVVLTLLNKLRDTHIRCHLGCLSIDENEDIELAQLALKNGISVSSIPVGRSLSINGIKLLNDFIKNEPAHLIHSHGYKPNILLALSSNSSRCRKIVTTVHGWAKENAGVKLKLYELLNQYLIKRFKCCIAVSNGVRSDLLEKNIAERKTEIIRNGIELNYHNAGFTDERNFKAELGIPANTFIVGSAGRLVKEKGFDILIQSLQQVAKYDRSIIVTIAGDGPLRPQLADLAHSLGVGKNVIFTGYINDIYKYLNTLDLFVLPSRTEGLPMILLEALNAGLACICSNIGGVPEVIQHGKTGFLFDVGDSLVLAKHINTLRQNKTMAENVSQNARYLISNCYSAEKMTEGYINLYQKIIGSQKG